MTNGNVFEAKLPPETLVNKAIPLFKEYAGYFVILEIENIDPKGAIEIFLAGHDGTNYVTKPQATLQSHQSYGFNSYQMQVMPDFHPNEGHSF